MPFDSPFCVMGLDDFRCGSVRNFVYGRDLTRLAAV